MRIAVTGSSGLIGSALVPLLAANGHTVVKLVRAAPKEPGEVRWHPDAGAIDAEALAGVDGVVHLAGEGIGAKRWSRAQKDRILQSRVRGTSLLAAALAGLDPKPAVLVSGSAVGYYGLRGDEELTEASRPGGGFLAEVVQQWEGATGPAEEAGIRTVHLRTGIVLSNRGGALGRMLPLFKLGLGGRLGRGDQWWSWISLEDEVRLIAHLLEDGAVSGPVNGCAPAPVTNAALTKALAKAVHRPAVLPVPKAALSLVMGRELTEEVILAGQRASPTVALGRGFTFRHPDIDTALREVVAK